MSAPRRLGRRAFLEALLAAAAWGAGAPVLLGCGRERPLAGALSGFYRDPASARVVGGAFLERFPEEGDVDGLLRRLAAGRLAHWQGLAASDPGALADALRQRHRADLGEERVVTVRGWVLSRTEARLCALLALLPSEPG